MVYIRSKTSKNDRYLYLVKSVWDAQNSTSKQHIIKYLGKASTVKPSDIPPDYRDDPNVTSFLASNIGRKIMKNEETISRMQDKLFDALISGDMTGATKVYESYSNISNLASFYDSLLRPVLQRVGDQWVQGKLGVAQEHIASNLTIRLINIITVKTCRNPAKHKIIICTPNGESHSIGCMMLQSFLQSKGYEVFNASPSTPSEEILSYVQKLKPDLALVSVTLHDNIKTAQRLITRLQSHNSMRILAGGQAVVGNTDSFACDTVCDEHLDKIHGIIKGIIAGA